MASNSVLSPPRRLLIVEDEASLRSRLGHMFTKLGFDVDTCDGAIPAIELLQGKSFDLVISEVRMPKGPARDLLTWMNRNQASEFRTPVILMSAHTEVIEYTTCQLGVNIFLMKPLEFDLLIQAVEQIFDRPLRKAN